MSERRFARRRYLLTAGVIATAGCLRLSDSGDGESNADPTAGSDDEATGTPAPTATTAPTESITTGPTETTTTGPYDGWFSDTANFSGIADVTGNETLTVLVGGEGNDGQLAFSPPAIRVSKGTTVVWEWTGAGGQHNVRVERQPAAASWDGYPSLRNGSGFTYEYTFDVPGTYLYYCAPHKPQGMKGAIVVDDDSSVGGGGGSEALQFGGDGAVDVGLSPSLPQEDLDVQYGPFVDHLERYLSENYDVPNGLDAEAVIRSNYAVVRGLGRGTLDVAETGPFAAAIGFDRGDLEVVLQRYGYGTWEYESVVAVQNDSDIDDLSDLSGKTVAFSDRLSSSGALFPLYSMATDAGLDIGDLPEGDGSNAEFDARFVGGHVSSFLRLEQGQVDAAAMAGFVANTDVGPSTEEFQDVATVLHEDSGIPRAPIVVSSELDDAAKDAVREAFLDAPDEVFWGEDGQEGTADDPWFSRVRAADAETYRPVLDAVEELDIGIDLFES